MLFYNPLMYLDFPMNTRMDDIIYMNRFMDSENGYCHIVQ
jgi:hypothetical protein